MLEGGIKLKITDCDTIRLVSEVNNREVFSIDLEDDYYQQDTYSFAKELMGQCLEIMQSLEGKETMIESIEEELCENWGSYEIIGG